MKSPIQKAVRLSKNRTGATAIEYGLIAALIMVALITGAEKIGEYYHTAFASISVQLK